MEKNVAAIAGLLGQTADVVKESYEKDELDSLITNWKEQREIYTEKELQTLLSNNAVEYLDGLVGSGERIPQKLYNHVKGNALESEEKKIAKQYGIDIWEGTNDLVSKIVEKNKGKDGDDEKDKEIGRLKDLVLETEKEMKKVKTAEREKYDALIISQEIQGAAKSINIDAEGETLANQTEILMTMFDKEYTFKREDGRTVAYKGDVRVNNRVGDPTPIKNLLNDFAPKWVKVETVPDGGRGDKTPVNRNGGFKNADEFFAYCEKEGIKPYSKEMREARAQAIERNPDLRI